MVKKSKNSKPGGERDNESSLFNTFGKKNKNKKKPPRTSSLFENDSSSTSSLSPVLNVNSMVTRKLLLKDCNFMVECGIPAEEVTKIDLGYLTVGSLISVYKESYKSIGEFNKNGVATLELPPRALSTIYAYLSNLDYKI